MFGRAGLCVRLLKQMIRVLYWLGKTALGHLNPLESGWRSTVDLRLDWTVIVKDQLDAAVLLVVIYFAYIMFLLSVARYCDCGYIVSLFDRLYWTLQEIVFYPRSSFPC
jgi:hypothetical protein